MSEEITPPQDDALESETPKGPGFGLVIGGLTGGLALGAAIGVFLVGPMVARASGYSHKPVPVAADSAKAEGEKTGEGAKSAVHSVPNLVLNPAGSNGSRFLMCEVAIELSDEKLADVLTSRDAEVRDTILRVLGVKTVEELADVAHREVMKDEVRQALDVLFKKKGAVRRLYFPQFVIQ